MEDEVCTAGQPRNLVRTDPNNSSQDDSLKESSEEDSENNSLQDISVSNSLQDISVNNSLQDISVNNSLQDISANNSQQDISGINSLQGHSVNKSLQDESRDNSLTDDFSDEEDICRSPAKSPKKSIRNLVPRNGPSGSHTAGDGNSVQQLNLPTDADFQFKEPKFRKKKFIFHPFKRAADDSCIPDPSEVARSFDLTKKWNCHVDSSVANQITKKSDSE
jgi:hypothetical protein